MSAGSSKPTWHIGVPRIDLSQDPVYFTEYQSLAATTSVMTGSLNNSVTASHSQVINTINCDFAFESSCFIVPSSVKLCLVARVCLSGFGLRLV